MAYDVVEISQKLFTLIVNGIWRRGNLPFAGSFYQTPMDCMWSNFYAAYARVTVITAKVVQAAHWYPALGEAFATSE